MATEQESERESEREHEWAYVPQEEELPLQPPARIWPEPPTSVLTCRELTIAHMVAQGKPNKIIAYELCLSEQTVKNHIVKICRKIGVRNRSAIALWVIGHKRTVSDVITTIELSEGTKYRDGHFAPAANSQSGWPQSAATSASPAPAGITPGPSYSRKRKGNEHASPRAEG
jgi:DNA-binding CsgD family transcriptional regulator